MSIKVTLFSLVPVFWVVSQPALASNALLQPARPAPEWFTRGVMYQIQPRAFTQEGTLRAAAERLDGLRGLGVTIVYLLPVFEMDTDMDQSSWSPRQIKSGFNNPKNQYRIRDYFHVDSEYGTDADLRDFVAKAHGLGLKVLFDLVYFHCGPTARVIGEFPSAVLRNPDGSVARGHWRFPQFDFSSATAREFLLSNLTYLLIEFGADGFRCDVGDAIPIDFWCEARHRMDALKGGDAVLLCEGFDPQDQLVAFDADYGWYPRAFLDGKEGATARSMREAWEKREHDSARGARFVNHYENHDIATDLDPRRERLWGADAVEQVLVWMFTMDGVPLLFNGNEIADDDGRHSMFGKTPIDWSRGKTGPDRSRLEFVRTLAALRASRRSLTDLNGEKGLKWLGNSAEDKVTVFRRIGADGERTLVVQNWTGAGVEVEVRDADFSGAVLLSRRFEREGRRLRLGAFGFAVVGESACPPVAPFSKGERVVFLGDSITRQGWYEADVQMWLDAARPELGVKVVNAGVSGDTADGALMRFDWDLKPMRPDRVFVMFGMNDVDVKLYTGQPAGEEPAAKRGEKIAAYERNMRTLVDRILAEGWRLVLMTPTPYDEYSKTNKGQMWKGANEKGLSECAEIVRRIAREKNVPLVELHRPLTEAWKAAADGDGFTVDRVHPSEAGYRLVAAEILKAAGVAEPSFPTNGPAYEAMRDEVAKTSQRRFLPQMRMDITRRGGDPENRESFEKTVAAWCRELESSEDGRRYIDWFSKIWDYYRKEKFNEGK